MVSEDPNHENGKEMSNGMAHSSGETDAFTVKAGLAQMLKGGVIMDVVNAEQVRIIVNERLKTSSC